MQIVVKKAGLFDEVASDLVVEMNVTGGSTSVSIMVCTQRTFVKKSSFLFPLMSAQQLLLNHNRKPHTVQAAPVPIMKTQGWRILADVLLLFHGTHTQTHWATNMSAFLLSCHVVGRPYFFVFLH